jgi:hypothetical protein
MANSISVALGDSDTIRCGCRVIVMLVPGLEWTTVGKAAPPVFGVLTAAVWQAVPTRRANTQTVMSFAASFALVAGRCWRTFRTSGG